MPEHSTTGNGTSGQIEVSAQFPRHLWQYSDKPPGIDDLRMTIERTEPAAISDKRWGFSIYDLPRRAGVRPIIRVHLRSSVVPLMIDEQAGGAGARLPCRGAPRKDIRGA